MNIKEGAKAVDSDFYYDLFVGGHIDPEELLEDVNDIERVQEAIDTIDEFRRALLNADALEEM